MVAAEACFSTAHQDTSKSFASLLSSKMRCTSGSLLCLVLLFAALVVNLWFQGTHSAEPYVPTWWILAACCMCSFVGCLDAWVHVHDSGEHSALLSFTISVSSEPSSRIQKIVTLWPLITVLNKRHLQNQLQNPAHPDESNEAFDRVIRLRLL